MAKVFFPQFQDSDKLPDPLRKAIEQVVDKHRNNEVRAKLLTSLGQEYLEFMQAKLDAADTEQEKNEDAPTPGDHVSAAVAALTFLLEQAHKQTIEKIIEDILAMLNDAANSGSVDKKNLNFALRSLFAWSFDYGRISDATKILLSIQI